MPVRRLSEAGLTALPALLVLWFSFHAGGYFPNSTGFVAVVVAILLTLRLTLNPQPIAGISLIGLAAIATLGLFALWTLASAWWSDAPARAMVEFDRVLLYLLVLALYVSVPRTAARVAWMVRLMAFAIAAVAIAGLITRVLPDVWTISPNVENNRLSFPLTYWNALGILATIGLILCLHLTSYVREHRAVRVVAAALVPAIGCAIFFTFSRGALAVGIGAVVLYALVARPRALVNGLLATVPTTFIAVKTAYGADLLATPYPGTPAAVDQGHRVAVVCFLCVIAAALIRGALTLADERVAAVRVPGPNRRLVIGASAAVVVLVLGGAALAAGAPHKVSRQYDRFVHGNQIKANGDLRSRLTNPGNNGRLDHWRAAMDGYRENRLHGTGAGTYQELWAQHRREQFTVNDGHSLYVEVLGELGIVGLLLVVAAILVVLVGVVRSNRGAQGATYGAIFVAGVAWALHAGVDWDWEMPAVTLPFFALGGAALSKKVGESPLVPELGQTTRAIAGIGVLILAISPWLIASSQARIVDAARAFKQNDCPLTIDKALSAISVASVRPEPYALLAYCDVRGGQAPLGVQMMQNAVARDPDNWEYRYGLALVKAAAGQDPRADARKAQSLNPLEAMVHDARKAFDKAKTPRGWQRAALAQPLPVR